MRYMSLSSSDMRMPEKVLKPGDWDNRRDGQFRPMIGFSRNTPRANLGQAGHRMLGAEGIGRGGRGGGGGLNSGVAIAPPDSYGNPYQRGRGRHSWDGGNRGGAERGGGGGHKNWNDRSNRFSTPPANNQYGNNRQWNDSPELEYESANPFKRQRFTSPQQLNRFGSPNDRQGGSNNYNNNFSNNYRGGRGQNWDRGGGGGGGRGRGGGARPGFGWGSY